jgi:predicted HTH domain antitoxin
VELWRKALQDAYEEPTICLCKISVSTVQTEITKAKLNYDQSGGWQMSIIIPDEILQSTRLTAAEIMQELALALFQREKLTLGQASRLAGMSQWQFQQLLGSRNIPIHYGVADFEADLNTLDQLRQS